MSFPAFQQFQSRKLKEFTLPRDTKKTEWQYLPQVEVEKQDQREEGGEDRVEADAINLEIFRVSL